MAKNITEILDRKFKPVGALFIYCAEQSPNADRYYIESRSVLKDGTFGAATPVSKKFITDMVHSFRVTEEKQPHGPMPSNMLLADARLGHECFIWWEPPMPRPQFFTNNIAIEDGNYMMPGVIYMATGDSLSVYAFRGKKPGPKTRLLYGPFFNYYANCSMCLGSARADWPNDITWQVIQEHWQKLFWASENSHLNHNPMKEGENLVLALKAARDKPFDTSLLRPTDLTLQKLLSSHAR